MAISKSPKVSVITPVYNTKIEYLKEAIESILSQTFKDFEFLILNDSPNNIEIDKCVLEYQKKDKRIKYFKNEKNMDKPFSRNRLIDLSKGEYLAIFDSDDISLPTRLEKEVKFLDEHLGVGVVGSSIEVFGAGKSVDGIYHYPEYDIDIKLTLTNECCLANPSVMIRKSVLIDNNVKYDLYFNVAQDWKMWCDLMQYTYFHNLQEVLIKYRRHASNSYYTYKSIYHDKLNDNIRCYVKNKYPYFWEEYKRMYVKTDSKKFRIRLFNIIPLLKLKNNWIYLFDFIPLFKIKF